MLPAVTSRLRCHSQPGHRQHYPHALDAGQNTTGVRSVRRQPKTRCLPVTICEPNSLTSVVVDEPSNADPYSHDSGHKQTTYIVTSRGSISLTPTLPQPSVAVSDQPAEESVTSPHPEQRDVHWHQHVPVLLDHGNQQRVLKQSQHDDGHSGPLHAAHEQHWPASHQTPAKDTMPPADTPACSQQAAQQQATKQLNKSIMACIKCSSTLGQLAYVIDQHSRDMDGICVTSVLTHAGRLASAHKGTHRHSSQVSNSSGHDSSSSAMQWQQLMSQYMHPLLKTNVSRLDAVGIALCLHSIAKMGYRDAPLMNLMVGRSTLQQQQATRYSRCPACTMPGNHCNACKILSRDRPVWHVGNYMTMLCLCYFGVLMQTLCVACAATCICEAST